MENLREYSVVIPAFNAAKIIHETIESIMKQTHPPVQIIVVDDGSTDDLSGAIAQLEAPITLIHQINQGPGNATSRGILEVKTEYLATVDADDLWLPNKIERQFQVLQTSGANIAFCRMETFGEGIKDKKTDDSSSGWSRSTMLLRLSDFNRVGPLYDLPGFTGEMIAWIDEARAKKMAIVMMDEYLSLRRIHPGSLTWERNSDAEKGYMQAVLLALKRRKDAQTK